MRQEPDQLFYWVKPGPRRLSPRVFGTPENPRFGADLLNARIEEAKGMPEPLADAIPQLLEDLPPLVAAPEGAREEVDDEDALAHEVFTEPTLYSDEAEVTEGEFEATYADHQPYDTRGPPGDTADAVDLDARFTDPAGHEYELAVDHVVQPPIPGYETAGGVMADAWHHGQTGTGSPLMPKLYAYGAFWAVGDVIVDGEVATDDGFRVIHFMTTQTVRDNQYRLVLDEELPLAPENTIAGQVHHTHGVVLPIRPTDEGPVFDPVPTAFELPNGETQPFIHAMWEQEELVEATFDGEAAGTGDGDGQDGDERVLSIYDSPGDEPAEYQFTVSGDLRKSDDYGATVDDHDTVEGSTATGHVWGMLDSYRFTGEVTDFRASREVVVILDGEEVTVDELVADEESQ